MTLNRTSTGLCHTFFNTSNKVKETVSNVKTSISELTKSFDLSKEDTTPVIT